MSSVAISADGALVATGCIDGTVKLWDSVTGKERTTLTPTNPVGVTSLTTTSDGGLLAVGSIGKVTIWDTSQHNVFSVSNGQAHQASNVVTCVAINPDKTLLAHANYKTRTVQLWDVATRTFKTNLDEQQSAVNSVAFSSDGKCLAFGGYDKTVLIWDLAAGTRKSVLKGHTGAITSVDFGKNGTILASGSVDKTVRLWDVMSARMQTTVDHPSPVWSVSISSDGKRIASGSDDGTIKIWETPPTAPE